MIVFGSVGGVQERAHPISSYFCWSIAAICSMSWRLTKFVFCISVGKHAGSKLCFVAIDEEEQRLRCAAKGLEVQKGAVLVRSNESDWTPQRGLSGLHR